MEGATCGVPLCSILRPLLFLLYVNDLPNASKILDPIMFADDTNLFFSSWNIPLLFAAVNTLLMSQNQSIYFSIRIVKRRHNTKISKASNKQI